MDSIVAQIRALGVSEQVAGSIGQLVRGTADPDRLRTSSIPMPLSCPEPVISGLARIARALHRRSLKRADIIGEQLMGDTSWHMLLALTADDVEGKSPSVTSLCADSGSPATTALRHLAALERLGLIRRMPDMRDARRLLINFTPEGRAKMREAVLSFCAPVPTPNGRGVVSA